MLVQQLPLLQPKSDWVCPSEFPDLSQAKVIGLDLETRDPKLKERGPGAMRKDGYVVGISVATDYGYRGYFPTRHEGGGNLDEKMVYRWLADQIKGPQPKCGAHLIYDMQWLACYANVRLNGPIWDVQIAEPLLDEESTVGYALEFICKKYLGRGKNESLLKEAAAAWGVDPKTGLWMLPARHVGPYAESDASDVIEVFMKQKLLLEQQGLWPIFEMESELTYLLLEMYLKGVRIDEEKAGLLSKQWKLDQDNAQGTLDEISGKKNFDAWSNEEIATICQTKSIPYSKTDAGNPSFTAPWLKTQTHEPFLMALLSWRKIQRLREIYVDGLVGHCVRGRVHCQFHPLRKDAEGTRSGRFSCLSGEAILETSRGPFRLEEYTPVQGDTVISHTGKKQKVLRKIYKGRDFMYKVVVDNGCQICCTANHKFLTSKGWVKLKNITQKSEIYSYEHIQTRCSRRQKNSSSSRTLLKQRETYHIPSFEKNRRDAPYHSTYAETCSSIRSSQAREIAQAFSCKDGGVKPYEGQEWKPASKAHWRSSRWTRLRSTEDRGSLLVCSSVSDFRCHGTEASSQGVCGSSHRREPEEQPLGQPVLTDAWRSSGITLQTVQISEITCLGEMDVWDIEVEEDHSFLCQGFINHNSTNPNLQQVPSRDEELAPLVRGLFIPDEGASWCKLDYSQQEPRVLVHYACLRKFEGAEEIANQYRQNPKMDYYKMIAESAKISRSDAKQVSLALFYGMGIDLMAYNLNRSIEEAKEIYDQYNDYVPFVKQLAKECSLVASHRGFIKTVLGRHRHFEQWEPVDRNYKTESGAYSFEIAQKTWPGRNLRRAFTHKSLNALVQGSSADMTKLAMLTMWKEKKVVPHLTVHDEIDQSIYSPEEGDYMKRTMESVIKLVVPIYAEKSIGPDWGHTQKA